MYEPAEDTFFLDDVLKNYQGKYALEIGIGSGYLTHRLCQNFELVVGTDISFDSLLIAKNNSLKNDRNKFLVCTDLGLSLKNKFDLIVSNPPYLPEGQVKLEDQTIHGGPEGIELSLRLAESCVYLLSETGKLLIVRSNLSNLHKMDQLIKGLYLQNRVVARKRLFFEILEVVELSGINYQA